MNALERLGEIYVARLIASNRLTARTHGERTVYRSKKGLIGPMSDEAEEASGWNHVLDHMDRKGALRTNTWTDLLADFRAMYHYKHESKKFRLGVRSAIVELLKEFDVPLALMKRAS